MSRLLNAGARWIALGLLLLGTLAGDPAWAHKASGSYLTLSATAQGLEGRWDIALRDLDFALGLDADGDGELTWGEVRTRHAEIAAYARSRLALRSDGRDCAIGIGLQQIDEHTDGRYSVLPLAVDCPAPAQRLAIDYRLFADLDPSHRGLLKLTLGGQTRSAVLGGEAPAQTFEVGGESGSGTWTAFVQYAAQGVWHIWIGFDHILFLLSLLLPAVLVWQGRAWRPAETLRTCGVDVLKVVTAFTLAHSVTLSMATLGWVALPSRLVESAIAASVVAAALNNVWPVFQGRRWAMAFGFGLIHGFGFASVLGDLGLPDRALLGALLGFNLGVEAGQLAIVLVFLPLAFSLRGSPLYRRGVMTGGSLLIAALAAVWLVERVFDVELLGL